MTIKQRLHDALIVKPVVNRFDNRLDVCLHDAAGCPTGCTIGVTTGCIV